MFILVFVTLWTLDLPAQVLTWEQFYGTPGNENGNALATLTQNDGDVALIGSVQIDVAKWGISVSRVDRNGAIVWENSYPDPNNHPNLEFHPEYCDIIETANGEIVWVATVKDVNQQYPSWDVLVGKVNANGTTPSIFWIPKSETDEFATSIVQTSDGQFVVAGIAHDAISLLTQNDIFATKFDIVAGTTTWSNAYGNDGRNEEAWDIKELRDGRLMLCGRAGETSQNLNHDGLIVLLNANGTFHSAKRYGKLNSDDLFHEMYVYTSNPPTVDDFVWACGLACPNGVSEVMISMIIITTTNFSLALPTAFYNFAGVTNGHHGGFHIAESHTADDHFVVSGFAQITQTPEQELLLMEVDGGLMTPTWVRTYPGGPQNSNESGYAVQPFTKQSTNESGYWVLGRSDHVSTNGSNDWYLLRTTAQGWTDCAAARSYKDSDNEIEIELSIPTGDFPNLSPLEISHRAVLVPLVLCAPKIMMKRGVGEPANSAISGSMLSATPNPVEQGEAFTVVLAETMESRAYLRVTDLSGRVFLEEHHTVHNGPNTFSISTHALSTGLYVLQVRTASGVHSINVVVR